MSTGRLAVQEVRKEASKIERGIERTAEADLLRPKADLDRWGRYYILILLGMMAASGVGFALTGDFVRFILEVMPTTIGGFLLGLVLRVKVDTAIEKAEKGGSST